MKMGENDILYHSNHKFTGCYALPYELAQYVVHGPLWCITKLFRFITSSWCVFGPEIGHVSTTLQVRFATIQMQSDCSKCETKIIFHRQMLLKGRKKLNPLHSYTQQWTKNNFADENDSSIADPDGDGSDILTDVIISHIMADGVSRILRLKG